MARHDINKFKLIKSPPRKLIDRDFLLVTLSIAIGVLLCIITILTVNN